MTCTGACQIPATCGTNQGRVARQHQVVLVRREMDQQPELRLSEVLSKGEMYQQTTTRNVDVKLPGKGNSNSHSARPVHLIITIMK
jgi:hypothetical protein